MKRGFLQVLTISAALAAMCCTALVAEADTGPIRDDLRIMFPGRCTLAEFVPGSGVVDNTTTVTAGAGYIGLDYDSQAEKYDTLGEWETSPDDTVKACYSSTNTAAKTFMVYGSFSSSLSGAEALSGHALLKDGVEIAGLSGLNYRNATRYRTFSMPAVRVVMEPGECLELRASGLFTTRTHTLLTYLIGAREIECHDRHL